MGLFDNIKKAVNSEVPRKIKTNKTVTIEELYEMLRQHEDEFPVPFKLSSMLGKHITFQRHPQLELQLLVSVKGDEITVRPNNQEGEFETGGFIVKTADLKNGFGLQTELNRDDYVTYVTSRIESIVNGE